MSNSAAGIRTGQRFQRTYRLQVANAINLTKTYLRDTVILDDTGASADVAVTLPKIGTAYAPVGLRSTFKKSSNVAHALSLDPDALDGISAAGSAAFPSMGAAGVANAALLPPSVVNSVTLEATNMALTGSVGPTQPNPAGGTPTTEGAWMVVQGVPNGGTTGGTGNTNGYIFNGKLNQFNNGLVVIAPGAYTLTADSVIQITRHSNDGTAIGIPSVVASTVGGPGTATFTVRAEDPATGAAVAADDGFFDFTIIG